MSQRTARASRTAAAKNGSAVEKLPDLEDYLSLDEKAQMDADRIKNLSRAARNLGRIQALEECKDGDAIPGTAPEDDGDVSIDGERYRSFRKQRQLLNRSYRILWDLIERDGYRANVQKILDQGK